ncbi:MAG TPA: ABC transporter substrate-binding protein [Dehalococcoidia bacterium]|jgi:peptide/nickel transport system substrate-binding protein|nr:ABC transporter substrate-binding protein [Dehalococcoidia bacterium]
MASNYWQKTLGTRVSRRRALIASGGLTASAAFLAACGDGDDSGGSKGSSGPKDTSGLLTESSDTIKSAKKGGSLVRNINSEPPAFDPHQNFAPLVPFYETVLGRLVGFKPGVMKAASEEVDGDIAQSWEVSPDLLTLTFKLRPGVKFHPVAPINGRALDAQDVLFSWERFSTIGTQRSGLANTANPDAPVLSMNSPDASTIVVKLKDPLVYAVSLFGARENVNIVPKEAADQNVFDLRSTMIGTGPYYIADYQRSVSITLKRHPDFYDKSIGFVDEIKYPLISEYAQMEAQFRAGNLLVPAPEVAQEEVLQLKREADGIDLYNVGITATSAVGNRLIYGWKSEPLRDERVRQAFSMSYDRDLWIETWNNASKFESEGLPVERRWYGMFPSVAENYDGWRLEPLNAKEFGDAAKYYEHNLEEAKKLLSAAGYPNGFELTASYPAGTEYGVTFARQAEVRLGFNSEIGIKFKNNPIDYRTEFIPKYRDVNGQFEGVGFRSGPPPSSGDPVAQMTFWYYSKAGPSFLGFDANGRGDGSGDPKVDDLLKKAQTEPDAAKRKSLLQDLERHLSQKQYVIQGLGGATSFNLAWDAVQNYNAYQGASQNTNRITNSYWWLDQTKKPFA